MTDTIIAAAWVCVRDRRVLVVRPTKAAAEIGEIAWFTPADADRCAPAIRLLVAELATAGLI